MKSNFDYESKPFGVGKIKTSPWYIPALKLKYSLDALRNIKGNVLEIGCGGGAMARGIKHYRSDLDVFGTDISKSALEFAKSDTGGVKFYYADVYKMPFKDNTFDAIVSYDVFEHLENLDKAFFEVNRILKPNGVLHIAIPLEGSKGNIEGILSLFGWKPKEKYCGHVNRFSIGSLEKIAKGKGFSLQTRQFSTHIIAQTADALYFTFIALRGKNFPYQVEGYVATEKGIKRNIIMAIKSIFATITYAESMPFHFLPGLTSHLTFKKEVIIK